MNSETLEEAEILRKRIEERISGLNLEGKEPKLNAFELGKYVENAMSKYNAILVDKVAKDTKKMNKAISKARLLGKKVPYVSAITPTIYEDGSEELVITFMFEGRCKGIASVSKDMAISFEFMKPEYSIIDTVDILNKCYTNFVTYFNALDSFYLEYPNISYDWGNEHQGLNNTQELDDGFIKIVINSNKKESTKALLTNPHDYELARNRVPYYGELYDFVDFYNANIQKSFEVNEEKLNPLFKRIVEKSKTEDLSEGQPRVLRVM